MTAARSATRPMDDPRPWEQVREHYEIEKELAARLRRANREERRGLYPEVYGELMRRVPHHPSLAHRRDPKRQAPPSSEEAGLIKWFVGSQDTYLELGPGDGSLAVLVAAHARRVIVVDVTDESVRTFQTPDNFELVLTDGTSIPVSDASVNVAFSNQVMEHLHPEDALAQLREIHRILVPGGIYLCVTPNRLSGPHDISRYFDDVATGLHLREYTNGEVAGIFRRTGFRKCRRFLSRGSHVMVLPVFPAPWLEWFLERLPAPMRRAAASWLLVRLLMGGDVKILARK